MGLHSPIDTSGGDASSRSAHIHETAQRACARVAPLWPLQHFVAVNPYMGLADKTMAEANLTLARAGAGPITMDRAFFARALESGRISDADLAAALARSGSSLTAVDIKAAARGHAAPTPGALPTAADIALAVRGEDWPRFVENRISSLSAGHFDRGQAAWRCPWSDADPYTAWHAIAILNRTPEVMGLKGTRDRVKRLPTSYIEALPAAMGKLAVTDSLLEDYLLRLLTSMGGWAGYARYIGWDAELAGGSDETLISLLTVRACWETLLIDGFDLHDRWQEAWSQRRTSGADALGPDAFEIDMVLQAAYEENWRRTLVQALAQPKAERRTQRPKVQAAFCIDVRSEVFRRAFESVEPEAETIGFAGFFGLPIEYVPLGLTKGGAQCPVLLTPAFTIRETVAGAQAREVEQALNLRRLWRRANAAWKSFKLSAVSSFAFVETIGISFAGKLATDGLGLTRPVPHPLEDGLSDRTKARLAPDLSPADLEGRASGLSAEDRLTQAEAILRAMSMTGPFAPLVILAGHGSTTVNNPHATGLDCGACGGHTGEANARVAAMVMNDPDVRVGLRARGIDIPDDTVFLGALHDTTTDDMTLYDRETVPASHHGALADLEGRFAQAASLARAERAAMMTLDSAKDVDGAVRARARDWSQVRPEWGLAGCAAFIAAPRRHTQGLDLDGRVFLHSYDWEQDQGFKILELIMTAPMVVASWINLQYYGSVVDPHTFGSGNKTLHNVVGTLGVLEGNSGTLRSGLPWQSVHDGEKFIHEPMRLAVMIAAPTEAMTDVIARHGPVRDLLDHGWLHLYALNEDGCVSERYAGNLEWTAADAPA